MKQRNNYAPVPNNIIPVIAMSIFGNTPLLDKEQQEQQEKAEESSAQQDVNMSTELSPEIKIQPYEKKLAMTLYSLTTVLLFADQNLLAPNLSAIADEFRFSDIEKDVKLGGNIALAFFLVGAPASFFLGVLCDKFPTRRSFIFAVTVFIGEGSCLATYFTTTYRGLFWTRVFTGFSVGGGLPIIYSLLGDWFVAEERAKASSLVVIGCGVGIAFGQGVAGYLGPLLGWRFPFLVVSIPAIICAALLWGLVKDPMRGGMERCVVHVENIPTVTVQPQGVVVLNQKNNNGVNSLPDHTEAMSAAELESSSTTCSSSSSIENDTSTIKEGTIPRSFVTVMQNMIRQFIPSSSSMKSMAILLKTRTVLLTLFQGAPGCIPWGIVNTYLNDYLSTDRGFSVQAATTIILIFGVGNFLGVIFGGFGGTYLYSNYSPRHPPLLAGTSAILGCIPFYLLLKVSSSSGNENSATSDTNFIYIISVSLLSGFGSGITSPIVKATLANVSIPSSRGVAFALLNTFDDFGRGLGPVFVAGLVTMLDGDRLKAFQIGVLGWVLCGLLNLGIYFVVEEDEDDVQRRILLAHDEVVRNGVVDL